MQNHFYLYILKCINGAYYVGHTDNIEQRLSEHNLGTISNCYTINKRPLELVFLQNFPTRDAAFHAERQIKGWSRKKKEAFMQDDWEKIKALNILQKKDVERSKTILQPAFAKASAGRRVFTPELAEGSGRARGKNKKVLVTIAILT